MKNEQSGSGNTMIDAERAMASIEIVVRTLGPLESEERRRVIQAALVILGERAPISLTSAEKEKVDNLEPDDSEISPRAKLWMKQNGLTTDQLLHVFDISDGVATVIASGIPGKVNSEKTIKAYLLTGVSRFLSTGEPTFEDKAARSLCEAFGFYDTTNHAKHMKDMGNNFAGTKDKGWKLTAPGLKSAADLIKELVN